MRKDELFGQRQGLLMVPEAQFWTLARGHPRMERGDPQNHGTWVTCVSSREWGPWPWVDTDTRANPVSSYCKATSHTRASLADRSHRALPWFTEINGKRWHVGK